MGCGVQDKGNVIVEIRMSKGCWGRKIEKLWIHKMESRRLREGGELFLWKSCFSPHPWLLSRGSKIAFKFCLTSWWIEVSIWPETVRSGPFLYFASFSSFFITFELISFSVHLRLSYWAICPLVFFPRGCPRYLPADGSLKRKRESSKQATLPLIRN